MENKYLQVRKENVFTKFINFFKKLFYKEQINTEENINSEIIDSKKEFLDEIKLEHEDDSVLINLQKKYENKEISKELIKYLNIL